VDETIEQLPDWTPKAPPSLSSVAGRTVVVERFDAARHGSALFEAIGQPQHHDLWEFIPMGPFFEVEPFTSFFEAMNTGGGWHVLVFRRPNESRLLGTASFMNVRADAGAVEIGSVIYSPELKRTTQATELQYLLASHVFDDLGYRRCEWKCDARNAASRSAALRLGFSFEGIFRKHMIVRGLSRDTAWFSITDDEWPTVGAGYRAWLAEDNFGATGTPLRSLSTLRG